MIYNAKTACADLFDFGSVAARYMVFVPLYAVVKVAHRRNISIPHKVTNIALHGQRKARDDLNDIVWYYFG